MNHNVNFDQTLAAGMETHEQLDERLFPIFSQILSYDKPFVIVAHGGVGRSLERYGRFTVGGNFDGGGSFLQCVFYHIVRSRADENVRFDLIAQYSSP